MELRTINQNEAGITLGLPDYKSGYTMTIPNTSYNLAGEMIDFNISDRIPHILRGTYLTLSNMDTKRPIEMIGILGGSATGTNYITTDILPLQTDSASVDGLTITRDERDYIINGSCQPTGTIKTGTTVTHSNATDFARLNSFTNTNVSSTVTGTSFTLTDAGTNKKHKITKLEGNTSQEGSDIFSTATLYQDNSYVDNFGNISSNSTMAVYKVSLLQNVPYYVSGTGISSQVSTYGVKIGSDDSGTIYLNVIATTGDNITIPATNVLQPYVLITVKKSNSSTTKVKQSSPTPSSPLEVNTVTGDCSIVACGRNIFDGIFEMGTINSSGVPQDSTSIIRTKNYINIESNTAYTLANPRQVTGIALYYYKDGTFISTASPTLKEDNSITFTTVSGANQLRWRYNSGYRTLDNEVMLLKGTIAMADIPPYQAYSGNTYRIDLGGKNLLNNGKTTFSSNGIITTMNDAYFEASGQASATTAFLNTYVSCNYGTGPVTFSIKNVMERNIYLRFF